MLEPPTIDELADELCERDAVCGWFADGAEVGPRALGARCVVCRPDSARMRDRVNFVKQREMWRPLAPSLTVDEFQRSFPGVPSSYMLIAADARDEAASRLSGVVHVDGSARPQVVEEPGPFRDLLLAMGRRTGSECVICTSFNQRGEPMVYSPRDAWLSAAAMGLDLLAGDGWCARLR